MPEGAVKALAIIVAFAHGSEVERHVLTPVELVHTGARSCGGAGARLMHETLRLTLKEDRVWVDNVEWTPYPSADGMLLAYQVEPDAFMSMSLLVEGDDAWLTMRGIDAARRPCKDRVRLRVR
jgi:hypothetical protein